MRGIGFAPRDAAAVVDGHAGASCAAQGPVTSSLVAFDGFGLWAVRASLGAGATLTWEADHGDEGLYVASGEIRVGTRRCPAGGAVLIEAGVVASVTADAPADVVHVGPHDPEPPTGGIHGPPDPGPRSVHVVGPGGTYAATEPGRDTRMFADSTCPTCRITLFVTARDGDYASSRHSHSADELLYVLRGEIHVGSHRVAAGDAVAIRAGHRYSFRGDPDGFALLNYRRDASEQTTDGDIPRLEGGRARGLTPIDDLR